MPWLGNNSDLKRIYQIFHTHDLRFKLDNYLKCGMWDVFITDMSFKEIGDAWAFILLCVIIQYFYIDSVKPHETILYTIA